MAPRKFGSGIDLMSQQIKHVADGSATDDGATYGQLLNLMNGKDFKEGVRVASTANVTISAPGTTIDGVTLATGERVLLKNQTTTSQNGIWVFQGSAAALTRPADFPTGSTGLVTQGATTVVAEGTTNAGSQWTLVTSGAINVDTTALTWTQTTAQGATYTADSTGGLQLIGSAFSAKLPGSSGLVKDATGLYVDKTLVMTRFSQDIGDGSTTAIVVTHGLGTRDVHVAIYDKSTNAEIETDVVHTSTTTITLNFAVAPTTNAYRVVVIG
jgi:hypothetical protein